MGVYLALALALAVFQRSLIYPAPPTSNAVPAGFEAVTYRTADGLSLRAGYHPAAAGKSTVVFFHGNGTDWRSSVEATGHLVAAGYGVLAAEYRGYGGNPGKPSEEGLYADGRAALAWLNAQGVEPGQTVLIGNSIGTGVAVEMAKERPPAALVLISPFNSLEQLVGEKVWWLPTSLLLRDHFRSDAKLPLVRAPVLILHGDADPLIPVSHARQLASLRKDTALKVFPGEGHELAWREPAAQHVLRFLDGLASR